MTDVLSFLNTRRAIAGMLAAAAGTALIWAAGAANSEAAGTFLIRGDVVQFDKANGNFQIYIRHANSVADGFRGERHQINANTAAFYKYDSKQRKIRSTFGTTVDNTGIEVVAMGTFDDSNRFKANWVVQNDNTVKIRGTVRGQSTSNNYLTVELDQVLFQATGKAYKSTIFTKGERVRVHYDEDSTKFRSRDGNAMNEDEFSNNDEKVTLENVEVKFGSRFEADVNATITDGKWLF